MDRSRRRDFMRHARQALSTDNARPFDGDPNGKKLVVISMSEVGPDGRGGAGGFAFEAKIPRSPVNELGLTIYLGGDGSVDRREAAEILRELATLVEQGDVS